METLPNNTTPHQAALRHIDDWFRMATDEALDVALGPGRFIVDRMYHTLMAPRMLASFRGSSSDPNAYPLHIHEAFSYMLMVPQMWAASHGEGYADWAKGKWVESASTMVDEEGHATDDPGFEPIKSEYPDQPELRKLRFLPESIRFLHDGNPLVAVAYRPIPFTEKDFRLLERVRGGPEETCCSIWNPTPLAEMSARGLRPATRSEMDALFHGGCQPSYGTYTTPTPDAKGYPTIKVGWNWEVSPAGTSRKLLKDAYFVGIIRDDFDTWFAGELKKQMEAFPDFFPRQR